MRHPVGDARQGRILRSMFAREGRLRFDYRLQAGVSSQRLGMRVLEEEGVFRLLGD